MKFRILTENDIDVRVATINEKGCSLLLYKDARCDMNILDETVGAEKWQRKHYECKGNLFCSVGILFDCSGGPFWVWKDDAGAESYTEKEKGEASDSFKRACVNWGIGRELYTSPFIWVPADQIKIEKVNNKFSTKERFSVAQISYNEQRQITGLSIKNKSGKIVFSTEQPAQPKPSSYLCEKCKKEIKGIQKDDRKVPSGEIIKKGMEDYNMKLCYDCYAKIYRQENSEQ